MATTEERLAALEAKLAALTATTPTEYYTHQYSGEEIDAAVGRALTGGALDTSVTNVSNQLGTFVRPNLLDNWYFGRPVDQRGGMLQLAGTMIYSDAACTQAMFPSTKTTSIIKVSDIAAHPSDDSTVYVKLADCVRGYTGNGYTVDRWMIGAGSSGTLLLADSGLKLERTDGIMYLAHRILKTQIPEGNVLTYSVLTTSGLFSTSFVVKNDTYHEQVVGGGISLGWKYSFDEMVEFTLVNNTVNSEVTILAAKLELGPTKTLAHKEGERWVLNEVPEYGEQLRRCQRYFQVLPAIYWLPQNADGTNRLTIPIPDMRTIPAVTYEPTDGSTGTLYYDANLVQKNSIQFYATGVTGICGVKNIRISADL